MPAPPLAMHMANELLSIPIAQMTIGLIAIVVVVAARRAQTAAVTEERLPLMGVMGAFVFAAQMVNFTLPVMPGTSGHLGGGVLLAILLTPAAAIVTMAAILVVQCLLFQDGGLLAIGCNILNLGIIPVVLGGGLYRLVRGPAGAVPAWRQYTAAWLACVVGVVAGAAMVPIEAALSGVLRVPMNQFLSAMIGVHLVIGLVEGAITFAVLAFLRRVRPGMFGAVGSDSSGVGIGAVSVSILVVALLLAGVGSWFASTWPDGLEWSYRQRCYSDAPQAVANDSALVASVDRWQAQWSPMTDYTRREVPLGEVPSESSEATDRPWPNIDGWQSLAGVLGTLAVLGVLFVAARFLRPGAARAASCSGAADAPPTCY